MQINSEQLSGPDGVITTTFEYDGIQRLVKVTDTEGNATTSVYDMGDRRTEVTHPASGKTTFTYDALGNVLTKQTAELAKSGKVITYDYDYHRLSGISYPDHPENNVRYYYGGRNASHNRVGRLELIEDGTGATEYYYGRMGEVTKTRRTLIVPNQAIATYVTQWSYDSQNRLLEMIYPDEEKVTYSYDNGGQLVKVSGYKSYGYDYVSSIGYDKFGQRTYLKYGNGTETTYTYDRLRTRLENLKVSAGGSAIMDNTYTYDAVSNVLGVANGAKLPEAGRLGGNMQHRYEYDALYRLTSATGSYTGGDGKSASYTLKMTYDNMYRVTGKSQHLTQTGVQFDGTLSAGYDLKYTYSGEEGKHFQLAGVDDVNYSAEAVTEESKVVNAHAYEYDANGNLVFVNTSRTKKDGQTTPNAGERKLKWDEENRLTASDDNGFVTSYWYDASGERTVKSSGENAAMFVNAEFAGGTTNTAKFSLYVSPYLVASQGGRYTKHIYIGSQRIVSKLGDLKSYGADPRRIEYAGSESDGPKVDYKTKYAQQQQVIKDNFAHFDVPYNGADNNDYVDGRGFSDVDGSLEGAMLKAARSQAKSGNKSAGLKDNFQQGDGYEKYQFFYHPDHLGSSSFITNTEGEVVQHIEYVPYGEVFIEERNNVWNSPYLFNAKEFDEETGLYYYGARYYDPRLAMWMGVDAMAEKYPNMGAYVYCANNPVKLVDPDGNDWVQREVDGYVEIYYDREVTCQNDINRIYGDNSGVVHLDDGYSYGGYSFYNDNVGNVFGKVYDSSGQLISQSTPIQIGNLDVFVGVGDDCVNAKTLHNNLFGTSYTGPTNPQNYNGDWNYDYIPHNASEMASMRHDKAYDAIGAIGVNGALFDTRTLSADYRLALENGLLCNARLFDSPKDALRSAVTSGAFYIISAGKAVGLAGKNIYKSMENKYVKLCNDVNQKVYGAFCW